MYVHCRYSVVAQVSGGSSYSFSRQLRSAFYSDICTCTCTLKVFLVAQVSG